MRCLILSDIHANLYALEAVMADAKGRYDSLLCLGDIVGYGAEPNQVTEAIRESRAVVIRGNHDRACTGDPTIESFTELAYEAARWTLDHLKSDNLEFLKALPAGPMAVDGFHIAHGSPRDEDEYVFSRDEAAEQYSSMPHDLCFIGHTHLQGGFGLRRGRTWELERPGDHEAEVSHRLEPDTSYLINPGSVGQPRDLDPRAGYAVYDTDSRQVTFRRVTYKVAMEQRKIIAAGLPMFLAARLALGR